jgi:hypothetical protein
VYVFRLASLEPLAKEIFVLKPERRYQRMYARRLDANILLFSVSFCRVALWEFTGRFTHQLCSHLPHPTTPTPICSVVTIVDFDNVSLRSLWGLRSHLQEASALATANYPETLHITAVVNSPSFFPTVWGWIKVQHHHSSRPSHCKRLIVLRFGRPGLTKELGTKSTY